MHTVDKAIVHPVAHKVLAVGHVLLVLLAGSCLGLGQLVLVVREDKVPADEVWTASEQ